MRHRRQTWLLTRWFKQQRQAALDAAAAAQEAEREAARRRVLEMATMRLPMVRHTGDAPPIRRPAPVQDRPLLTPGQAARSRWTVR